MVLGTRAHDYGKRSVEELCRAIAGDGWKTIQLAMPKAVAGVESFAEITPEVIGGVRSALSSTGLTVAVLGVYVEPSLVDEPERLAQIKYLREGLAQAKELKAGCVGTETTPMKKQPGVNRKDALRQLYRSIEALLPEAERLGTFLAVEPVYTHALNSPELTRSLLDDMRSPNLKIIFDPVNLLHPAAIDSQAELWKRSVDSFGSEIVAVHIKGASREEGEFGLGDAPFKDSVVDYRALFENLRSLEHYARLPALRELGLPANAKDDIEFMEAQMS